jgi:peroxiredoxin Q/BCP
MKTSLLTFAAIALVASSALSANPTDFTVNAVNRTETFQLSKARGQFVALHFLLKTECPFCLKHTQDYARRAASVPGVVQVFLKPDTDAEIKKWSGNLGDDSIVVYRDPDAKLAQAFGIPGGYAFHGQTVHYPALVLLDGDGKEVFRYVGKSNRDRLPFDQFAAKIAELRKKSL